MATSIAAERFRELPGGELLAQGFDDLRHGVESVPALLVQIGGPRLRRLDLDVPVRDPSTPFPEHRLYELLSREHGDAAHSRYNALLRTLSSFARALECAR